MKAAIVGAGIMGQLLAWSLVNAGWQVSVFDRRPSLNCSMAAAGLLTPITELLKNPLVIAELGIAAIQKHWPNILQQLSQPVYFQNQGSLVVAHPREQAELQQFAAVIRRKLASSAYNAEQEIISVNRITDYEPELTRCESGYYFPTEGCIDNQKLLQCLAQDLVARGVDFHSVMVQEITAHTIVTESSRQTFDWVLDCRGLAAKNHFADLRGVRGELVMVQAAEVHLQRPLRLLNPRYSLYIVPRPQNIFLIGASEIEAEDNSEISVKTLLELLSSAYYLHPGFSEARVLKTLTQSRPTLADQLPKINYQSGLIAVNGLYRHGFLIAPTLAADILNFLENGLHAVRYPSLWGTFSDETIIKQ